MGNGSTSGKPKKPKGFPLFPHANGQWAKKVKGRLRYFGPWSDPDAALDLYEYEIPYLRKGLDPPAQDEEVGATVRDVVESYLDHQLAKLEAAEITQIHFGDCRRACDRIVKAFGIDAPMKRIGPEQFRKLRASMARKLSVYTLACEIGRIRCVFSHAIKNEVIDRVRYGTEFNKPALRHIRARENQKRADGLLMFEPGEVLALCDAAVTQGAEHKSVSPALRAMILLGANAAFGNADVGLLKKVNLDLDAGWVELPRSKTAVRRRAKLWAITVDAIKLAMACRPEPRLPSYRGYVFLTRLGRPWHNEDGQGPLVGEMRKLMQDTGTTRKGRGFYGLRHGFATVASETLDAQAVAHIMGHTDNSMMARYIERIDDERLIRIADHVHAWLFGAEGGAA